MVLAQVGSGLLSLPVAFDLLCPCEVFQSHRINISKYAIGKARIYVQDVAEPSQRTRQLSRVNKSTLFAVVYVGIKGLDGVCHN